MKKVLNKTLFTETKMTGLKPLVPSLRALMFGALALQASYSVAADSFTDALTGGKPSVDINVRYESVDISGGNSAVAITERTRLGYGTAPFMGVKGFVEMSGTESLGARDQYHVGAGPDADTYAKAVIADPVVTRLNQAWLGYQVSKTNLKLGKQRVIIDPRFVGNVGWRQTEQVFTGLTAKVGEFSALKLNYAYLTEVNTLVDTKLTMQSHALKVDMPVASFAKVSGYGYFLDYDNDSADSQTVGLRVKGAPALSDGLSLVYHVEFAQQSDYADANNVGGDYRHLQLGVKVSGVTLLAAQEVLGGDGTKAFQTPLATKHAYNGWADTLLTTPNGGLVDNYVKVATKVSGVKLVGVYHDFSADTGSATYGSELNLLAVKKFSKIYTAGVKYASYSADTKGSDTTKLWVWGSVKF